MEPNGLETVDPETCSTQWSSYFTCARLFLSNMF